MSEDTKSSVPPASLSVSSSDSDNNNFVSSLGNKLDVASSSPPRLLNCSGDHDILKSMLLRSSKTILEGGGTSGDEAKEPRQTEINETEFNENDIIKDTLRVKKRLRERIDFEFDL
jgi:hypothetical protein